MQVTHNRRDWFEWKDLFLETVFFCQCNKLISIYVPSISILIPWSCCFIVPYWRIHFIQNNRFLCDEFCQFNFHIFFCITTQAIFQISFASAHRYLHYSGRSALLFSTVLNYFWNQLKFFIFKKISLRNCCCENRHSNSLLEIVGLKVWIKVKKYEISFTNSCSFTTFNVPFIASSSALFTKFSSSSLSFASSSSTSVPFTTSPPSIASSYWPCKTNAFENVVEFYIFTLLILGTFPYSMFERVFFAKISWKNYYGIDKKLLFSNK